MSKPREPSPGFIGFAVVLTVLVGLAMISARTEASETPEDVKKNEVLISRIAFCRILAINGNMTEQAEKYTKQLTKFDDFYNGYKSHYTSNAIGFLIGVTYQMGFPRPTRKQVKQIATGLYFKNCGISF